MLSHPKICGFIAPYVLFYHVDSAFKYYSNVLNFIIFCGEDLKALLHIGGAKRSPTVINFRRETKQIRREQAKSLYHHKCSVCGRTDPYYPNLEFRYCSKCAGYHCFCEEHINSHIHFT